MRTLIKAILILLIIVASFTGASAQCSMCSANAEHSVSHGNTEGKSLNSGILFLLATPYIAAAVVGYIWYTKFRRKDIPVHIKDEKLNLN